MSTRRISRATLASQLEDAIREDVLTGTLRPGERLATAYVMKRYGVSSTPLREALQRLAGEGIVRFDPRYGASVAPVSLKELHDLYDLRLLFESEALRRAVKRADASYIATLTAATERLRTVAAARKSTGGGDAESRRAEDLAADQVWWEAHRLFDLALFEGCGSAWLLRFIRQLYDHSERYRVLARGRRRRRPYVLADHERIFEAVVRGDPSGAVAAHRLHWKQTVVTVEEIVSQLVGLEDTAAHVSA